MTDCVCDEPLIRCDAFGCRCAICGGYERVSISPDLQKAIDDTRADIRAAARLSQAGAGGGVVEHWSFAAKRHMEVNGRLSITWGELAALSQDVAALSAPPAPSASVEGVAQLILELAIAHDRMAELEGVHNDDLISILSAASALRRIASLTPATPVSEPSPSAGAYKSTSDADWEENVRLLATPPAPSGEVTGIEQSIRALANGDPAHMLLLTPEQAEAAIVNARAWLAERGLSNPAPGHGEGVPVLSERDQKIVKDWLLATRSHRSGSRLGILLAQGCGLCDGSTSPKPPYAPSRRVAAMIDEKAKDAVAKAIYEVRNGPGCTPWAMRSGSHKAPYLSDAIAAISALESAKPKEAAPLKLGSRLTVEGVEAVVVPVVDLQPIAEIADHYDGMFVEPDVPILAVGTARFRLNNARSIRAMLSAAGDGK